MTILTYDKRQAYWNWCREFIDREAIYRADDTHPGVLLLASEFLLAICIGTPATAAEFKRAGQAQF
jgi:hypothetical protein